MAWSDASHRVEATPGLAIAGGWRSLPMVRVRIPRGGNSQDQEIKFKATDKPGDLEKLTVPL